MVCREIISCPVVSQLRGPLGLCRITYCETGALPCALLALLREGKQLPALRPDGEPRPDPPR